MSTNIAGQSKRAFANAVVITFGGLGGIFPALVFRAQDSPRYVPGRTYAVSLRLQRRSPCFLLALVWVTVGCQLGAVLATALLTAYLHRTNG